MSRLKLIALLTLAILVTGTCDRLTVRGILPGIDAAVEAKAGAAGATTAVACGATSTALLAVADLGVSVPRHYLFICNNGPGLGYVAFGTSNAATVTNGLPLGPLECLPPMGVSATPNGVGVFPTNLDVACINDGAATANMTAIDW